MRCAGHSLSRDGLDWHGFATLATWLMTLFIQRAEHRDTQAIQAKLDELLQAQHRARNELMKIDEREPEEIERHRERTQEGGGRVDTAAERSGFTLGTDPS